jgi:hypothetical protein
MLIQAGKLYLAFTISGRSFRNRLHSNRLPVPACLITKLIHSTFAWLRFCKSYICDDDVFIAFQNYKMKCIIYVD